MAADMVGEAAARPGGPARRALRGGQRLAGRRHHARRAREAKARLSAEAAACPRWSPLPHSRAVDAGRSASPAVRTASLEPRCWPGLSSRDGAALHGASRHLSAGPRAPGPHRESGPRRQCTQPPPGRRGPMDAASWARCLPTLELASQAPGRCRSLRSVSAAAALGAPGPQQMVAERLAHSRGGAGRRVPERVRGRRELRGSTRGGATPDAIGGLADQWQRRAPANKENPLPMETGGGNKEHPGVR